MMSDDFFALNKHVAARIDTRIERFLQQKIARADKIDPRFGLLLKETERVTRLGGKRLRPTLAVVGYRAAGGRDDELVLDGALALELLHIFMCVHDDIMDRDHERHGGLNISGRYNEVFGQVTDPTKREHLAGSMALLAGDLLLTFVYEVIGALNVAADTRLELMACINRTTFETVGGQQLDVLYPLEGELSVEKLLKVPRYKTSMYTFVNPLLFGAQLAGSSDERLQSALRSYGESLGITYQVIDDILGVFGSSQTTGKSTVSDIQENKPTILRHYAFELADDAQRAVLQANFGKSAAHEADLVALKQLMLENGAHARTHELAERYAKQAKAAIAGLAEHNPVEHAQLMALADFCLNRDH